MLGALFDLDNGFWRWVGKVPEMFVLSFFWLICCLPVVTIVPASCALFDAVSRNTRLDNKGSFTRFFRSFLRELKRGIPLTLVWLLVAAVSILGRNILSQVAGQDNISAIFYILYCIMQVMLMGYICWLIPLQSRYYFSFTQVHINALRFFLGRLPGTALMLLEAAVILFVGTLHYSTTVLLLIAPALIAVLHSIQIEKGFAIAFPKDYVDGVPVFSESERQAAQMVSQALEQEAQAEE